ncbi:putative quinol monooxygenase [Nocardia pseudovaccinii]|uniref:putative quinol monooxygenase n=1 Tax=Nocardia pseudovaccinii TaxID=189540 RepID=UPI003D93D292
MPSELRGRIVHSDERIALSVTSSHCASGAKSSSLAVPLKTKPEWTDRWLDLVAPFTAATRAEPGNLWFDWSQLHDDEDHCASPR